MAIITCRECGKAISSEARTCPQCGCPSAVEKKTREREDANARSGRTLYTVLGIIILIIGLLLAFNSGVKMGG